MMQSKDEIKKRRIHAAERLLAAASSEAVVAIDRRSLRVVEALREVVEAYGMNIVAKWEY
jgi:hypothetical protein